MSPPSRRGLAAGSHGALQPPTPAQKALPQETPPVLGWLRKDGWLDLDRLQLHRLRNLQPRRSQPHGRIQHRLTKPYPPWTNGLVARMGVTIKAETVSRWLFDSKAIGDAARYGFERYFYEHRPYTVIGDNMPAQWTQAWYQKSHPLSQATGRIVHNLLTLDC